MGGTTVQLRTVEPGVFVLTIRVRCCLFGAELVTCAVFGSRWRWWAKVVGS